MAAGRFEGGRYDGQIPPPLFPRLHLHVGRPLKPLTRASTGLFNNERGGVFVFLEIATVILAWCFWIGVGRFVAICKPEVS